MANTFSTAAAGVRTSDCRTPWHVRKGALAHQCPRKTFPADEKIILALDLIGRAWTAVVTETDIEMPGSLSNKRRAKVTCPRPTAKTPRASIRARAMARTHSQPLFDVLHLLAKLVDHRLQRQTHMGELNVGGFRTQRIRLTVKFLCKEIELAPRAGSLPAISARAS